VDKKKENVALSSVMSGFLLTGLKLVVGILTGSMGIISEAAHSALDLVAAFITFFAVKISKKPADTTHNFGHGKVENVSALAETLLLFFTCAWIIYEAVLRLISGKTEIEIAWYSFAVMLVSIIVDFSRSRALSKVAKETKSQALEADALHFSSDIYSSIVVIAGLGLTYLGLKGADSFAAIAVALFVLFISYGLGKRTIAVLIDTTPAGLSENLKEIVLKVEGVVRVKRLRMRPMGSSYYVDMIIDVSRKIPLERTKQITKKIETEVRKEIPDADVIVHLHPIALKDETIAEQIHIIASNMELSVHNISVQEVDTRKFINFDLEVDNKLLLKSAHQKAAKLEGQIKKELGEDLNINTHIEPEQPISAEGEELDKRTMDEVNTLLKSIQKQTKEITLIREVTGRKIKDGIYLSIICVLDDEISLEESHKISEKIENILKEKISNMRRASIHMEPK
jgi:cation diffusion facilitator family transporter